MPSRREFLGHGLAASLAGWSLSAAAKDAEGTVGNLHLAPFRFDVTPPKGHSCCGGWIKPVEAVDDPLEAIGLVLLGSGKPVVLCAVDWTGLLNEAHLQWRAALAEAAATTPDRVAVHCVHQHNAPFACLDAQRIVEMQGGLPDIIQADFFRQCLDRGRESIQQAVGRARPLTHIAHGQGRVEKVASNRRVFRDERGHVRAMRGSSCRDPELRALEEGLIDPWLRTVAFYQGHSKLAACHYYATHPMSYYGDGRVTSDFVGLARKQRQQEQDDCVHIWFTGCAGNIAAGKYNDGSTAQRPVLTRRVYEGITKAELGLQPEPIEQVAWQTVEILPKPRATLSAEALQQQIADPDRRVVDRNRPSYMLSWLRRVERQIPIVLSTLKINDVQLLHLPAECFIQYQLRAQELGGDRFVATAAYGDGGPWYIPIRDEYPHGGYEVSVAFCDPQIEDVLTQGMRMLLR